MSEFSSDVHKRYANKNRTAAIAFEEAVAARSANQSKTDLRVRKVELVVRCQELARFLRGFDELNWANWLEECVVQLRHDSVTGAEALLDGCSGIGCVNDMYLCPEAGHRLNVDDETAINEQFLLMLSKVNNLAREILGWGST